MEGQIPREGYAGQENREGPSRKGQKEMGRWLRGEARAPGSLGRKGGGKPGPTITILPLRKLMFSPDFTGRRNSPRKMTLTLRSEWTLLHSLWHKREMVGRGAVGGLRPPPGGRGPSGESASWPHELPQASVKEDSTHLLFHPNTHSEPSFASLRQITGSRDRRPEGSGRRAGWAEVMRGRGPRATPGDRGSSARCVLE